MNEYLPTPRARCRHLLGVFLLLLVLYDPLLAAPGVSPPVATEPVTCTAPGAAASVSGSLTCAVTAVTLSGTSTASDVIYSWSGPGGFQSMSATPTVTLPGPYTLTVTRASDATCSSTATVTVQQNITLPGASAAVSGGINCATGSVTLLGSTSATTSMTFLWIGPNGFTANTQNVTVQEGGGYTLNVRNPVTGCTSTAVVIVNKSIELPGVAAYVDGDHLSCANATTDLEATSPTTGVTYSWTGPENFSSSIDRPEVTKAGTYTVRATNPANSCTSTANVTVRENVTLPGATATVSGEITCAVVAVELTAAANESDINYLWTSPTGENSYAKTLTAVDGGIYQLKILKISNGCESHASVEVKKNTTPPDAMAGVSGPINCLVSQVSLQATTATSPATFKWIGSNGYSSTDQNPVVTTSGGYTLTVTNPTNGCTTTKVAVVQRSITPPAGLTATVSAELTCSVTSVNIAATSTTSGVTFRWTGPGTITNPNSATATVSEPGTYTVTATNPVNGCTSTFAVLVRQNSQVPTDVVAQVSGILTCTTTQVTLSGTSTTVGMSYQWTGPHTITNPNSAQATVSEPGVYTLTVTNPANGCQVVKTVTVGQDILAPEEVTASVSAILTCVRTTVQLTGASSTAGVTYRWTGPGTITNADQAVATVSAPGIYTLMVTHGTNGCFVTKTVTVGQDIEAPANLTASASGTITCTVQNVTLSAISSTTSTLTYSWTGPEQFMSTAQRPSVAGGGAYTVVATNPANGCTSTASTTVLVDKIEPGVTASVLAPATLNCNTQSVIMTATSGVGGVQYSWTGPQGYSSAEQNPSTTAGGVYTVVATNPNNGCTSSATVTISEDKVQPAAVSAAVSGVITCLEQSVILEGHSSTVGVTYRWTGPSGFVSTEREPETDVEGVYTLTVTNPVNGCKVVTDATVERNSTAPQGVGATAPGILTCDVTSLTLVGSSTTPGVTFNWTGPGTITNANTATPTISQAGTYTLDVINPANGCSATAAVTVGQNKTQPAEVTAIVSGAITCNTTSVTVTGGSSTADVTYEWTGPNGFRSVEKNFPTNVGGVYTVTVKHPVSGCTVQKSVTVSENRALPADVTAAASGQITCAVTSVTLTGASGTADATYSWSGPGVISNPSAVVTTVSVAGEYILTVTHPVSGCTQTATVTVTENKAVLDDVAAVASGDITCAATSVLLSATSGNPGATFQWAGPGAITNPTLDKVSISTHGLYTVTARHPLSGCTVTRDVTVAENKTAPDATATPSALITCVNTTVPLTGGSSTPNVDFRWTGPNPVTNPTAAIASVSAEGQYTLTVTDRVNGCTSNATETVTVDRSTPSAGAISSSAGFVLTCYTPTATLSCTAMAGATVKWVNAAGTVLSITTSVSVSAADTYSFIVTHPVSGCTTTRSRAVTQNRVSPTATLTATGKISCTNPAVTLNATSSGSPVTYNWSGPGPVTVINTGTTTASASVTVPGTYTLTVTTVGGCTSQAASVTVAEELGRPLQVTAAITGDMCADSYVTLVGTSSTTNATYRWNGPVESTEATLVTTVEGEYTLTVTNPLSGCTEVRTLTVSSCSTSTRQSTHGGAAVSTDSELEVFDETTLSVKVYPNPVASVGVFEFTSQADGPVSIELYSLTNVRVGVVQYPAVTAGKTERVSFDMDNYASGVYLYRVILPNQEIKTGRVVVEH